MWQDDDDGEFVIQSELELFGFVQIPTIMLRDDSLSNDAKMLWLHMESYRMNNSYCFPSVKTLCKVSGYSKNSVIKYRRELVEADWLGSRSRKAKSGANASNIYTWQSPYLRYIDKRNPKCLKPEIIESFKRRGIDLGILKRLRDGDPELEAAMETEVESKIKNKTRNKIKRDITREQNKRLDQVIEATSK